MTSRGRDSVAETGTPASALYVIESAANGARLHEDGGLVDRYLRRVPTRSFRRSLMVPIYGSSQIQVTGDDSRP